MSRKQGISLFFYFKQTITFLID